MSARSPRLTHWQGQYLTEQPLAFFQVVLKTEFIDAIMDDAPNYDPYNLGWTKKITDHLR